MSTAEYVEGIARKAREASRELAHTSSARKNAALRGMAARLRKNSKSLISENAKDLEAAESAGLSKAFLDRLRLDEKRVEAMARGIEEVAALPDPVGEVIEGRVLPNGLRLSKVRIPIGVIAIIYESRPNVTADSASLCLKSGNAVILRGGKEAIRSNLAISEQLSAALAEASLPETAIQVVETTEREAVGHLLKQDRFIDLIIPRGGEELIRRVTEESRIPVIKHYKGLCHIYIDEDADFEMAEKIVINAKCQRPGVCNAVETLLVHEACARQFLPRIAELLRREGVELRGCPRTLEIIQHAKEATEEDWSTEYLDLILSIRVVGSLEEATDHIARYSSSLSEAIVTGNLQKALRFTELVDSAAVYVNASTRFTDGGEFGMGAEIGISTDKLHARGPMGVRELTSYKWTVFGNGQVRS